MHTSTYAYIYVHMHTYEYMQPILHTYKYNIHIQLAAFCRLLWMYHHL